MRNVPGNFALILVITSLAACATPLQQNVRAELKKADIEFTVMSENGISSLQPQGNQACSGPGNKVGCVVFEQGEAGTITFRIKNGKPDEVCDGSPPEPQWVIRQVRLTAAGDLEAGKGDFTGKQPEWLRESFPQVNLETSVVYSAGVNSATSSAVVINLNDTSGERFLFYEVAASNCAETEFPRTDPVIQNKGK